MKKDKSLHKAGPSRHTGDMRLMLVQQLMAAAPTASPRDIKAWLILLNRADQSEAVNAETFQAKMLRRQRKDADLVAHLERVMDLLENPPKDPAPQS